jgi:hypothetical protein
MMEAWRLCPHLFYLLGMGIARTSLWDVLRVGWAISIAEAGQTR